MSGWNADSARAQDTAVMHHPTPGVLDMSRPMILETERSVLEEFCSKQNFLTSIAYVNQELELLGLKCLMFDGTKCTSGIVFIVNRMYDLLSLYHKTAEVKNDLEIRNHRLLCETEHQHSSVLRMKKLQEQTDRELDQEREKARQISLKYNQVCNQLRSEKEEVKRLTTVLQSRDLQHRHEHKKKEKEVTKLKERLHQLLADKVPDRKVGMELMNVINRKSEDGKRATWKTGPDKQEEEMYQILISSYEDRQRELIQENGELRDCLLNLQRELTALHKRTTDLSCTSVMNVSSHADCLQDTEDSDYSSSTYPSVADLDEGYFQMPYDIIRHDMERMFRKTCEQISNSLKSFIKSSHKDHSSVKDVSVGKHSDEGKDVSVGKHSDEGKDVSVGKHSDEGKDVSVGKHSDEGKDVSVGKHSDEMAEIKRLKKQVSNYKIIIQQQEEMIQHSLTSHSQPKDKSSLHESRLLQKKDKSSLHESRLLQEKENLSEQRKFFTEEKAIFEKERKALKESVVSLSKEKQLLQDERAKMIKQHLLNMRPYRNNQHRRIKDGLSGRLLPATPVFSPAKTAGKVYTSDLHDVGELYTTEGLSQQLDQMRESVSTLQPGIQDISFATKCSEAFSHLPTAPNSASGAHSLEHSASQSPASMHEDLVASSEDTFDSTLQTSDTSDV